MTTGNDLEIFLMCPPGLEPVLLEEVREKSFKHAAIVPGGVTIRGGWPEVWRANLELRGAGRVTVKIAQFKARELYELDKRSRKVAWSTVLRRDVPVSVEATCRRSRIYHSGAAVQRIARAIKEELGAEVRDDAEIVIRARIENDICAISVDTSGDHLHKRGHKQAVNAAPMRETLAALILRRCGYDGTVPVVDPMCGSGTFVIEAAEIAAGLAPGRDRQFAFERLATFDHTTWLRLRGVTRIPAATDLRFYGSDRDAGAITMSRANAARAGVGASIEFHQHPISDLLPPAGPKGLVVVNPPFGSRLGDAKKLKPLYRALGVVLRQRFSGWQVGIVATDAALVRETGLPFLPTDPPFPHGGLRITLFRTAPLP